MNSQLGLGLCLALIRPIHSFVVRPDVEFRVEHCRLTNFDGCRYHVMQRRDAPPPAVNLYRENRLEEDEDYLWDNSGEDENEEEELSDDELLAMSGEWDQKIAPFNSVHLTGRIGNDPEARYLDDGKVVVNLSLAVKRKYHPVEWNALNMVSGQEETDWYGLEIWGQTAEFVAKYVDKGSRVGVVGSLEVDEWNDRETGDLRLRAKVIVRDFDILETRAEAEARRERVGYGGGGGGKAEQRFRDDEGDESGDNWTGRSWFAN